MKYTITKTIEILFSRENGLLLRNEIAEIQNKNVEFEQFSHDYPMLSKLWDILDKLE